MFEHSERMFASNDRGDANLEADETYLVDDYLQTKANLALNFYFGSICV